MSEISKQKQLNQKEHAGLTNAVQKLKSLGEELPRLLSRAKTETSASLAIPDSANAAILKPADALALAGRLADEQHRTSARALYSALTGLPGGEIVREAEQHLEALGGSGEEK